MYSDAQCRVQVNASSSEPFKVSVVVHQGTVLSPLLLNIVMEALSREFRVCFLWELMPTILQSCTSCDLWVHPGLVHKCSGITAHLTDYRNFVCCKCSSKIVPAAIASLKEVNIGNDSFHVEFTFKCLGDTIG